MDFTDLLSMTDNIYKNTAHPIALTDSMLETRWANAEALRKFPGLTLASGIKQMIKSYDLEVILERLNNGSSFMADRIAEPFNLACMELYPVINKGKLIGCHIFFTLKSTGINRPGDDVQEKIIAAFTNEYKMPLTIIFSTLDLVAHGLGEGDEVLKTYIKLITQNCYRLLRLSNNLTESTRFNAGIGRLKLHNGDLCGFLAGLCEAAGILTGAIGIPLEYEVPEKRIITAFDPSKLSMAFFNLFSNSCKYSREGNKIKIKMEVIGENVVVTVADKGAGMKEEVLEHIFEPYFSYDHSGRKYGGAGLGLSLVKHIITGHGGTIAVRSHENDGTKVAFTLPIKADDTIPDYTAENSADYLADRFSSLYVELSDVCGTPLP